MAQSRQYRMRARETQRLRRQQSIKADAILRAAKQRERSPRQEIEIGLSEAPVAGELSRWISIARSLPRDRKDAARRVLFMLADRRSELLREHRYIEVLIRMAEHYAFWRREPESWHPRSHNLGRQMSSLLRHLFADYPVPAFFDSAWFENPRIDRFARRWFIHIGRGENLRTATGLPFPMTKRMSHWVMQSTSDLSVAQALRWGQTRACGGSDRLARAVAASRLSRSDNVSHEEFWLSVIRFFCDSPMLDPRQVGPIIDYLQAQRFEPAEPRIVDGRLVPADGPPQPNLSMKGRTVGSLIRQVEAWHRTLDRTASGRDLVWARCSIAGFDRVEGEIGNQRRVVIVELTSGQELIAEGRAMSHCVGSYARSCAGGRVAIFSLRVDAGGASMERRMTIEVTVTSRTIVQARAKRNAKPDPVSIRVMRAWAAQVGLQIGRYAVLE